MGRDEGVLEMGDGSREPSRREAFAVSRIPPKNNVLRWDDDAPLEPYIMLCVPAVAAAMLRPV